MIHKVSLDIDGEKVLLEIYKKNLKHPISLSKFERQVVECALSEIMDEYSLLVDQINEE